MGCWPFLAVELVTACFFFQAVSNGDPPDFVWSLFFILSLLYILFAVNQVLQFRQVRGWRGFAQAEWWYIILSLASKQLLAWITYGAYWRYCWVLLGDREEPRAGGRGRCAGSSLDAGWFWRGVPGALSTKVCRGLVCGR
jgi:hypothetical protein